ncbi:hypothetical protein TNIN_438771 [Trichonephila inaurata madagascariensis]|uniref:Uncharacterized protein n=1 Tax=Trichonephila inaurata madagascariensis TaxID=2747483 RepID=A0A8X6IBR5_9ARAC|nr:hypothetical protein TNIN_438771 [Trichonephila inaurata madagascariensis]
MNVTRGAFAFFPLKVLRYTYFGPTNISSWMPTKFGGRLSKTYMVVARIIICQKILALWKDFHYVIFLRQFCTWKPRSFKTICRRNRHFRNIGGNSKEWI